MTKPRPHTLPLLLATQWDALFTRGGQRERCFCTRNFAGTEGRPLPPHPTEQLWPLVQGVCCNCEDSTFRLPPTRTLHTRAPKRLPTPPLLGFLGLVQRASQGDSGPKAFPGRQSVLAPSAWLPPEVYLPSHLAEIYLCINQAGTTYNSPGQPGHQGGPGDSQSQALLAVLVTFAPAGRAGPRAVRFTQPSSGVKGGGLKGPRALAEGSCSTRCSQKKPFTRPGSWPL